MLLLDKYASDQISSAERNTLLTAISSGKYDELITEHIAQQLKISKKNEDPLMAQKPAGILKKILFSERQNAVLMRRASARAKTLRWAMAAAVTSMIILLAYLLPDNKGEGGSAATIAGELIKKVNTSNRPMQIRLEEGSLVTLQPGAAIFHPPHFLPNKREVSLEGAAFFEVSKNTGSPFFVYCKNIVTHVLGTSFNIQVNEQTGQVEVSVRSGRVEVYENTPGRNTAAGKMKPVVLLPNQKVNYEQESKQFVQSLVDVPLPVAAALSDTAVPLQSFVFEEAPLKEVLSALEKNYGIDIVPETAAIFTCLFTGDISQQDLYTRLDIICKSVQASYEIKGTKILITGRGCR